MTILMILAASYLGLATPDQPKPAPNQLRLPLVKTHGGRIFVKILSDNKPGLFLIDTGCARCLVDGKTPELEASGDTTFLRAMSGHKTNVIIRQTKLDFGNTIDATVDACVLDLTAFRNATITKDGWPPIDGALGADVLAAFKAVVDYENSVLILNIPR